MWKLIWPSRRSAEQRRFLEAAMQRDRERRERARERQEYDAAVGRLAGLAAIVPDPASTARLYPGTGPLMTPGQLDRSRPRNRS